MIIKSKWVCGITVIAVSIGLLALLSGCPENGVGPSWTDGTITLRITGAGDHNGRLVLWGVLDEGVTDIWSATLLGGNEAEVVGGIVESVACNEPTYSTPVIFTGGMTYVVVAIIDATEDDIPTDGDYITDPFKTVEVDGDMVVEFVYPTDFMVITGMPEPEDGTITVRVTGASDHNGTGFYYAVGAEGDDLSDPANWLGVAPPSPTIADGTVECITVVVGTNDPKTFTGGESYDASGMIDVDDSGDLSFGDYVFGPETVIVDGETTLELVYPTDFTVEERWILGFWVTTRTYAPFSDVVELNADGTYSFYDNYDLSGGPVESGPWSLEGDVLTVGGTPYAITWISDDEWSSEDIGETFYRKGTEPGGYLYDQTETELSAGVWKEGTLPVHDLKLYSFMASSAGDYEVRWEQGDTPPYTAHVDFYVYRSDQATLIFVCREEAPKPSPQTVTLGASEKIFLIVYTRYEGGTFRIKVE